jgi:hypothetical protein
LTAGIKFGQLYAEVQFKLLSEAVMRVICAVMLAGVAMYVGGCAKGESYKRADFDFAKLNKIAIVDVTGNVSGDAAKNQISDFWSMELLKKGYMPVERAQIQSLLKEQQFEASGVTSDVDAVKAGHILNVPTVMIINMPDFGENMSMTAKMLDVQDGSILWLGSGTGGTHKWFGTFLGGLLGAGAGVAVGGQSGEGLAGGIIGGVVGGAAGHMLSPQEATAAQKLVKKIAEKMPSRIPVTPCDK